MMKLSTLETAAKLYRDWVHEDNNDVRVPNTEVRDYYYDFCKDHNIPRDVVEAYAMAEYQFCTFFQEQINAAKLKAIVDSLNAVSRHYDGHGDSKKATMLMEIASKIEV